MHRVTVIISIFMVLIICAGFLYSQEILPDNVMKIFQDNCIRCHSSRVAEADLDLERGTVYANTVKVKSSQKFEYNLVDPGNPSSSYLYIKISPGSSDERIGTIMPPGNQLSQSEIEIISKWISSLPRDASGSMAAGSADGFHSWNIGNLPTAEILNPGNILFTISHRFLPQIDEGYESFYGIDGPVVMMLGFDYPFTDSFMVGVGRSNAQDNHELRGRYRLLREVKGEMPLSLAVQTTVNWKYHVRDDNNETAVSVQCPITRSVLNRAAVAVVPGITFNPDPLVNDEEEMVTLGIGGRIGIYNGLSLFGHVTPVLSGFPGTQPVNILYDSVKRYDSWAFGVEQNISVHVFQVFVTNSQGIAMDQYLSGGDLDVREGEVRLGFAVFSIL